MRPISRPSNPTWQQPAILNFSPSNAVVVATAFNNAPPATTLCLGVWDDDVSVARTLTPAERTALPLIKARVTTEYRSASPELLDTVGSYCAYCELPLADPTQLEHVLPKSQYPVAALDWDNFLPACIGCNSRKREQPLRGVVIAAVTTATGATQPTALDCHAHVRAAYRFPDDADVDGFFVPVLRYDDGTGWADCTTAAAVDPQARLSRPSLVAGEVRADLPALGLVNVPVAAVVVAGGNDPRADATIDLCKLARYPVPGDSADRRTIIRTQAWFTAVRTLRDLETGGIPAALPTLVRDLVYATGFWWVWVQVARLIDTSLRQLLVNDALVNLPGTDPRRVP